MTSLVAVPPPGAGDHDIQQAMAEMHAAMAHLTSLLPEGYAYSGTATPHTLTPAVSRSYTANGMNGANGNGYLNGKEGAEMKPTASHDSASSCSSDSSDSDDQEEEKPNPLARFRHFIREPAAEFLGVPALDPSQVSVT